MIKKSKIAITLPPHLVAQANLAVKDGRARSVSAYVADALSEKVKLDTLDRMLSEMLEETGGPLTDDEKQRADRILGR
ncbi:MAG: hypothetical protein ACR2FO_02905 [Actinomycetota bacterium]